MVPDWAPCPPVPALAGTALADPAGVDVVAGAELELELELLLQPAAASSAAATAAKPILLCLRTVVPPGVGGSCRVISLERRGPGCAGASHDRPPAVVLARVAAPRSRTLIRLGRRFREPDQASVRRGGDLLHGLLR